MQGKKAGRELQKLVGIAVLGTGVLGLATPSEGALGDTSNPIQPQPVALTAGAVASEFDAVRQSGDPQAVLRFLQQHPDRDLADRLIVTLPRLVAHEVLAGLAEALAKEPSANGSMQVASAEKPASKATTKQAGPPGSLDYLVEYGSPSDVNPGDRERSQTTGGY
ncbi:MAG: hypothetical protein SGJ07_00085 [Rhodospirillaceae bacterium]|nr:hypothetical protein [Rhodospirillaceae bacterium]